MDWKNHIESCPDRLGGKSVIKGTRLSVLLGLLANGWTTNQVLENYPQLSAVGLQAVFSYPKTSFHPNHIPRSATPRFI